MTGKLIHINPIGNQAKNIDIEGKFYGKPVKGTTFEIGIYSTAIIIKLLPDNQFETKEGTFKLLLWW